MDAVRLISRCERPFDLSKLIYVHCIDLGTKKFTTVTSFPCVEIVVYLDTLVFQGNCPFAVSVVFCVATTAKANFQLHEALS